MTKALVTGGAGFIGSNTVDLLLEEGFDVAVADNLSTGKRGNINKAAAFHRVDLCSPKLDALFRKEKPDSVIHLAAQIDVRRSIREPGYDASVNVLGSINLLESCRKHGIGKLVYASSGGAIYGEPKYLPCDEEHPVSPLCPYGASKYAVEKYVQMYGNLYGLDHNIVRYGNVYGPRQDPLGEAGVVAIFTGLLSEGRQPVIWGDGRQTRDFCYVGDVAKANLAALKRKGNANAYNIGSGRETSVNEITRRLIEATGANVKPKNAAAVPGEVRNIYLDIGLAKKELKWRPKTSLKEGIGKTVEWVRNG
ncbi:MAG: NAD-dependent epimerase/dehydratase family protein [Candidatus Altiarchaeota archaeon]